jgi:hypothetical protein
MREPVSTRAVGNNGQASALLDVARRAEKAFGALQGVGVKAAGQDPARGRGGGVVGPAKAGDGVKQDHHIDLALNQSLGLFEYHFSHLHVPLRRLVEG